jgi:hypothetical protein
MRAWILAALLALAGALVVVGVALLSEPVAWIVGGLLLAGWSWLVLAEATA